MSDSGDKQNDKSESKRVAQSDPHSFFITRKKSASVINNQVRTTSVEASDQIERVETVSSNFYDDEIGPELNQSLNIPVDDISTEMNEAATTLQNPKLLQLRPEI